MVKREGIVALGDFHNDRVFEALRRVVFGQLGAETTSLDPNHGIDMGIEVLLAAENFRRNLVLLGGSAGMLQGMIGQIAEQLAERLRPVEGVTGKQFFDLFEVQRFLSHGDHRAGIVTPK
jgi:hypothetical protein